jgi:5'-nucleotidase / UDP-sugar diphosphatase
MIFTNDFHSAVPSAAPLLRALDGARKAGHLVIDAGDFFGASGFFEFTGGTVEQRILAEYYHAIVPGNHDLGPLRALKFGKNFPPVVCVNLKPRTDFLGRWEDSVILQLGPLKIGIVGFIGAQAYGSAPLIDRADFEFTEPAPDLLADERDKLFALGADYVMGVSHSGFANDIDLQRSHHIFAVLASGHCHTENYLWISQSHHGLVAKAPELGAGLVEVTLDEPMPGVAIRRFERDTGSIPMPAWIADELTAYSGWASRAVGCLTDPPVSRDDAVALIAEQILRRSDLDFVVLNHGAIRSLPSATVTVGDLVDSLPFDNPLVSFTADASVVGAIDALLRSVGETGRVISKSPPTGAGKLAGATTQYLAERLGLASTNFGGQTLRTVLADAIRGCDDG